MSRVTWLDLAEQARGVAATARLQARALEQRRTALARNALVWWQGESAERYRARVQERVNALVALAAELEEVAVDADRLADLALAEAAADEGGARCG